MQLATRDLARFTIGHIAQVIYVEEFNRYSCFLHRQHNIQRRNPFRDKTCVATHSPQ